MDMMYQLLTTGTPEEAKKRIEVELFTRLGGATGRPTGAGMSEGFLGVERAIEEEMGRDVEWEDSEEGSSVEDMEEVKGALFPGFSSDIENGEERGMDEIS